MADETPTPKLKLLQAASSANPFDPATLRMSLDDTPVASKVLLKVPIRKPGKAEFIRVNPNPEYSFSTMLLEWDKDFFLVLPHMREAVASEAKLHVLYTVLNKVGVLSLWPVRVPGEGDKMNSWWDSGHTIAKLAMIHWLRVKSNTSLGAYETVVADMPAAEPDWPDKSMAEILEIAFKTQVIDSPDCQILKQLTGRI